MKLEYVPRDKWPKLSDNPARFNVWRSDDYLVQAFRERRDVVRLAVTGIGPDACADGNAIPWDVLQAIKSSVGYGSYDAVEVFPPDVDVRGGGNARYLWILPKHERLPFIWRGAGHQMALIRDKLFNKGEGA